MDADPVFPPDIPTDVPTSARMYDYCLGGKDNFAIDREAVLAITEHFPEGVDVARENRLFLFRLVRHLVRDLGVRQFLDLGSGLPSQDNVHEVAQRFQPDAHVVYVDNDPIVIAHSRALLVNDTRTTVIADDLTQPRRVLEHEETRRLIDFSAPVAVLMLSVPHSIPDDSVMTETLRTFVEAIPSGGYLALSQFVGNTPEKAREHTERMNKLGMVWRTRTTEEVRALLPEGLELVEPGLADVVTWRPDPDQPPLSPVAPPLASRIGAVARNKRVQEYGGLLRKV